MLCGIDEAGRGPIAGPLVMAGVVLHRKIDGLRDSKQLSEKKRTFFFDRIKQNSTFHIVQFSAQMIDDHGMSHCLAQGLQEIIDTIDSDDFLFDGNTSFGVSGLRTMVKADTKIDEVSAASILAKVTRDLQMLNWAEHFPQYGFEKHKGYATAAHVGAIKKFGYCALHRKSFKLKALET